MIRVIVREQDVLHGANVPGAPADIYFHTFDVEAPELEAFLRHLPPYKSRTVIGVETPAEPVPSDGAR